LKFKVDENLPLEFASLFQEAGFDAATVADQILSGATDSTLLERCRADTRVLVSLDLDFANIQAHPPGTHSGIIIFRSKSQDKITLISLLKRLLPVLHLRSPEGRLWIVQSDRIRYRED
jgi:predicted nuclease of predicted toxin-antitoxin system